PIFIIDTGIPGDVEPAVNNIDGAFLYDLNDLERVAMEGRASRETEARDAWAIVDADVRDYLKGRAERSGVPALTALRERFEEERRKALAEAGNDAEKATRLLINRLLHDPSEATREMAAYGHQGGSLGKTEWDVTQRVLMRLFRLNGGKGENEKKDKPE
ncbi:MAG: glutamyl-tRNA reductase, partial [Rhodospirillales bacterium]|nr:glutamyl-tRNA reductase [Rhodospirillales bacterium]